MALMTWGPALQIGYGDIDVQHKRLVDLINALDDGVRSGHSRDVLADVLTELARYTQLHFAFEEKLMELYGLSDTEEHPAAGSAGVPNKTGQHLHDADPLDSMVGAVGFELTTLCSQSRCATRLRYAPTSPLV